MLKQLSRQKDARNLLISALVALMAVSLIVFTSQWVLG